MEGITIAPACAEDVPALQALLAALFSIEVDFHPDAGRQRRGLELLLADTERAVVMTARAAGDVVGMASAQLVVSTAEGAYSAWIEDVVVAERCRGRGIGALLLTALLDWARGKGATRAQLLADRTNALSLGFYRHLGWQATQLGAWRRAL
ncbi:MAG: GNAT family N-acetyltransferase [Betaproteobacteria bacterium]|nr:GNAT family N-acetyltransferase [Betaproteobacteria bacterium]